MLCDGRGGHREVCVAGLRLRHGPDGCWLACRPAPCPGEDYVLFTVGGAPSTEWDAERWHHASRQDTRSTMFLVLRHPPLLQVPDMLRPLDMAERHALKRRGRRSRPGPSGWTCSRTGPKRCTGAPWTSNGHVPWWWIAYGLASKSTLRSPRRGGGR